SMGLLAGRMAAAEARGETVAAPPHETAHGALVHHITGGAEAETFQPMNVNFGLFPPLEDARGGRRNKANRKLRYTARAKEAFNIWLISQQR
ncbi:MAG: FADH(2)-oxidizing methylenetetrahydrofolate--tRNA-(uracil(54)-C(5))-methyltransferase TrmFO, partial [Pseudomonadota bacterium]